MAPAAVELATPQALSQEALQYRLRQPEQIEGFVGQSLSLATVAFQGCLKTESNQQRLLVVLEPELEPVLEPVLELALALELVLVLAHELVLAAIALQPVVFLVLVACASLLEQPAPAVNVVPWLEVPDPLARID